MSIKLIKEVKERAPVDIIILAAGSGYRMKSYGPKCLIGLNKKENILTRQIRIIRDVFPINNIVLVCGFKADFLMKNSPQDILKIENEHYETTNICRSIGMGLRACKSQRVCVIYGDLIFNEQALECLDFNKSSTLVGEHLMTEKEVGCIYNERGNLENIMYDLPCKWSQITMFMDNELSMLKNYCWSRSCDQWFGFEVINKIIDNRGRFKSIRNDKAKVIDIDNIRDLERAKNEISF
jgi:choline kinase